MEKTKVVEKIKQVEREKREKSKLTLKRDFCFTNLDSRTIKRAKEGRPQQGAITVNSRVKTLSWMYFGKYHTCECWRKLGACLKCGSIEHVVNDCPYQVEHA